MRKKNGFTLTELLAVIAMIAVVGTVIIVNTIAINNRAKDSEYERMVENIKNAAKTYVSLYPDDFADLYSSKAFTYVSLNGVVKAGLLDEETINPYTKEKLDLDDKYLGYVKAYVDGDSFEMVYKYPLTEEDYNTQIWLQMTTINGTEDETNGFIPFSVFDGITPNSKLASIDFGFSNENGNLINATDPVEDATYNSLLAKYKDKFKITVDVPETSFTQCKADNEKCTSQEWYTNMPNGAELTDYYIPTKTGTFEIKYNWSYEANGTTIHRTDSRTIKITSQTSREKEKVSTEATTTSNVVTTADPNGIIFRLDDQEFKGDQPINTGIQLLKENLDGSRNPFSIYIEGVTDPSHPVYTLIDFINASDYSGFDLTFKNSNNTFELYAKKSGVSAGSTTGAHVFEPTYEKTYRMLLFFDPTVSDVKLFYAFTDDKNGSNFKNKKLSGLNGGYEDYIWFIRNSSEATVYVGGKKDKTSNFKGTLNKFIIFNKADPELIFQDF